MGRHAQPRHRVAVRLEARRAGLAGRVRTVPGQLRDLGLLRHPGSDRVRPAARAAAPLRDRPCRALRAGRGRGRRPPELDRASLVPAAGSAPRQRGAPLLHAEPSRHRWQVVRAPLVERLLQGASALPVRNAPRRLGDAGAGRLLLPSRERAGAALRRDQHLAERGRSPFCRTPRRGLSQEVHDRGRRERRAVAEGLPPLAAGERIACRRTGRPADGDAPLGLVPEERPMGGPSPARPPAGCALLRSSVSRSSSCWVGQGSPVAAI